MTIRPLFIAYILSSSVHALAAQNQCPVTCPTTDRVLRTEFQTGMQSRKRCANRDTSVAISPRMLWAVIALRPGTLVRSTPRIRFGSPRKSNVFGSYRLPLK